MLDNCNKATAALAAPVSLDTPATALSTTSNELLDLVYSMKLRGQQRPPDVEQTVWDSVDTTKLDSYSFAVNKLQTELSAQAVMRALGPIPTDNKSKMEIAFDFALREVVGVLVDPKSKGSDKLNAAMYLMDHTVGKAKQEIEHSGSLVMEIRAQAKKALEDRASSSRDVTEKQAIDKPPDAVDNFLNKYSPDNYIVGKKTPDDEHE